MFAVAIESQPVRKPKRITHRAVLNAVIESYQERIAELEEQVRNLKAACDDRSVVIKELATAKD